MCRDDELSSLLKISEYTLLDYARKGKIPAKKIANRWRSPKEDLLDWFHAPVNVKSRAIIPLQPSVPKLI
jgi:excisionase family DNA binding protein